VVPALEIRAGPNRLRGQRRWSSTMAILWACRRRDLSAEPWRSCTNERTSHPRGPDNTWCLRLELALVAKRPAGCQTGAGHGPATRRDVAGLSVRDVFGGTGVLGKGAKSRTPRDHRTPRRDLKSPTPCQWLRRFPATSRPSGSATSVGAGPENSRIQERLQHQNAVAGMDGGGANPDSSIPCHDGGLLNSLEREGVCETSERLG